MPIPPFLRHWDNFYLPKRFIVIGLCAAGLLISYADRTNLAVGIVYMAKEFDWDSTTQGMVLSAFFLGYFTTQVIGGVLSDKYGGKMVLGTAAACWSTFTFLTPFAARQSLSILLICRVLLGVGEGVAFPSVHSLIASWAPLEERSRMVTIASSSSYLGSVVALPISTWLGSGPGGWESIFYVFGGIGFIWCLVWVIFSESNPEEYKGIRKDELDWITMGLDWKLSKDPDSCGYQPLESDSFDQSIVKATSSSTPLLEEHRNVSDESSSTKHKSVRLEIPWSILFRRREVWAILIAQFCNSWGFFILLTWLPTFFKEHFDADVKKLGYFAGFLSGIVGDYALHRLGIRVIVIRRLAQILGSYGTAIGLLLAAFQATTIGQGVFYVTCGMGANAITLIGVQISQLDIAPRYAGAIFALGNTAATIPGLIGVAFTGWILDLTGNNWGVIWGFAASFYVVGGTVFAYWVGEEVVID
ncbi:hypothetical protein G9A89_017889 [Geosiphon pyriformis]|nr:hypothetical protein G9A89_017889 [Geosiphon pyriformis]